MTWRTAIGLKLSFVVWSSRSGFLPSLDDGESGARARLAFRTLRLNAIESVATSCSKATSCIGSP
jgi:hypothetical protein